ncbi:MAG: hypothetical protein ABI837_17055, partial [Acidobacteriota bacterium]
SDRPPAYDDVGRTTRWGSVLPELENFAAIMNDSGDAAAPTMHRRRADVEEKLSPPWKGEATSERRAKSRPKSERRAASPSLPSDRLSRSQYEQVFLKLGSGKRILIGKELLTPVSVKGWYHSVFTNLAGEERLLSIDQLLEHRSGWQD